MKKIFTLLIIFVIAIFLFACEKGLSDEEYEQVDQTISLIDLADANNQQTIDDALNSFNALSEKAKYEVSNYSKLFYLIAENPIYIDVNCHIEFSQDAIVEYIGKTIQIKSISDLSTKMSKIDFSESGFENVDSSIFENKTVLVTIVPTYWIFNENDEVFMYKLYPSGLLLVFYKQVHPFVPDVSYFGVRFIVLDTIYPITFLPVYQVLFTNQIPL